MHADPRLELGFLCALLVLLACWGIGHKRLVLDFPLTPEPDTQTWLVEAQVEFDVVEHGPVEVSMSVPSVFPGFRLLDEETSSPGYGVNWQDDAGVRRVVWTRRHAEGRQTLFYRVEVFDVEGSQERRATPAPPAPRKPYFEKERALAATTLVRRAYAFSADPVSLASQLLQRLSAQEPSPEVRLLLRDVRGQEERVDLAQDLLAMRGVASRISRGVHLADGDRHRPLTPMLEVYDGEAWATLDPTSGRVGVPDKFIVWQQGGRSMMDVLGGEDSSIRISVTRGIRPRRALTAKRIEDSPLEQSLFSLYTLPIEHQNVFERLFMVPLGALVVCLARNIVGLATSGTFMPVLLAMAFFDTSLWLGLVLFVVIVGGGLLVRAYLSGLNLLLVPRISAVVTVVIFLMAALCVATYHTHSTRALRVTFFPFVILAWTIERSSIAWEERGREEAMAELGGSLAVAILIYGLWSLELVRHLVFAYGEVNLILLAAMLLLGSYKGYRLVELYRFQPLASEEV